MTAAQKESFATSVFINCPFDDQYQPLLDSMVFTIVMCGFEPRCAKEINNSAQVRLEKLFDLIGNCKLAIHDISRTELDEKNGLPRFNMPLELGIDLGCRRFGQGRRKAKVALILDAERYRYQKFVSDLAGQDPSAHRNKPAVLISKVRDWLEANSGGKRIPGGEYISGRYKVFRSDLPGLQKQLKLDRVCNYRDYTKAIYVWLDAVGG